MLASPSSHTVFCAPDLHVTRAVFLASLAHDRQDAAPAGLQPNPMQLDYGMPQMWPGPPGGQQQRQYSGRSDASDGGCPPLPTSPLLHSFSIATSLHGSLFLPSCGSLKCASEGSLEACLSACCTMMVFFSVVLCNDFACSVRCN